MPMMIRPTIFVGFLVASSGAFAHTLKPERVGHTLGQSGEVGAARIQMRCREPALVRYVINIHKLASAGSLLSTGEQKHPTTTNANAVLPTNPRAPFSCTNHQQGY